VFKKGSRALDGPERRAGIINVVEHGGVVFFFFFLTPFLGREPVSGEMYLSACEAGDRQVNIPLFV
jgi:hypothetical protein